MTSLFRLNPLILTLLALIIGISAYVVQIPFLQEVELGTVDLRFRSRGAISPRPEVVLAVIDEKSINQEGKWVWPRSKFTRLVEKVNAAGARVLAFDVGFLEEGAGGLVDTVDEIRRQAHRNGVANPGFEAYLESLQNLSDDDRQLARTIAAARTRVVLGYFFHMNADELGHLKEADVAAHRERVRNATYKFVRYRSAAAQNMPMIEAAMPQSNIEEISQAAEFAGYFNMFPDRDGVVRWIPGVIEFDDMLYAPLSFMTASAYLGAPLSVQVAEYGVEKIKIGPVTVPTDELGRLLVNYRGPVKSFPHISVTDILHDRVPAERLADKIIMVGATAVGIYDLRVTPFGSVFPGLEIHANVVDSLLSRDFLKRPSWAAIFDLAAMLVLAFGIWLVHSRTGVVTGAVIAVGLFGGYIGICQALFVTHGWILNMVYPLLVLVLVYVGITAFKYVVESRQKRFIRDAFSTYLAPSVVKQLIESPESLVLGGEERVITAFFSDVQGFTSISERLSAAELVELLNEFLTEMTELILDNAGTVDKFEGDAIIAFFGAPNYLPNHAEVACRCCIAMQERLRVLRGRWQAQGRPELNMRIGMSTGYAVVGNMGSRQRMDYTMMGDTVNTAARLEGVNKVYGTYTMVSAATFAEAGPEIVGRQLDSINVVGKAEPVGVYELIGLAPNVSPETRQLIAHYESGLEAYRRRDWNRALIFFNRALAVAPDDPPSQVMIARCNRYKTAPPPEDWNGAFTMTTK